MTEEQNLTESLQQAVEQAKGAVQPTETEQEKPEAPQEPDGSKFVKADDPAVVARLKYLGRQAHAADERSRQLENLVTELDGKLSALMSKQQRNDSDDAAEILKQQIKEANAKGDVDTALNLIDRMVDLRTEAKLKIDPKPVPQFQQKQSAPLYTPAEAEYVNSLKSERQYLNPSNKDYKKAVSMASLIAEGYDRRGEHMDVYDLMEELHNRMKSTSHSLPEVLPSNLTNRGSGEKIRLSENQINVAKRWLNDDQIKKIANNANKSRVSIEDF